MSEPTAVEIAQQLIVSDLWKREGNSKNMKLSLSTDSVTLPVKEVAEAIRARFQTRTGSAPAINYFSSDTKASVTVQDNILNEVRKQLGADAVPERKKPEGIKKSTVGARSREDKADEQERFGGFGSGDGRGRRY